MPSQREDGCIRWRLCRRLRRSGAAAAEACDGRAGGLPHPRGLSIGQGIGRFLRIVVMILTPLAGAASAAERTVTAAGETDGGLAGPTVTTRQIVRAVAQLLPTRHFSQHPLDDEVSRQWLGNFISDLDRGKRYFFQTDIDGFNARCKDLADQARKGDASLAYDICRTLFERVQQRTDYALALVDQSQDFSRHEELIIEPMAAKYPTGLDEARELWKKWVKHDLLAQKVKGVDDAKARQRVAASYRSVRDFHRQFNDEDLLKVYLNALTQCYDSGSEYFSSRAVEDYLSAGRAQLEGVGLTLQLVEGMALVHHVIPGGPVAQDGRIKAGDRILGVGQGDSDEIRDVSGMRLSDTVRLIRGPARTIVRLRVLPKGKSESVIYNFARSQVQTEEVRSLVVQRGKGADGTPVKIGYVDVPRLYASTMLSKNSGKHRTVTSDLREILEDPAKGFKADGVDVVILDLRRNGGGMLTEAVSLSGLFIDTGPMLQVQDAQRHVQTHQKEGRGTAWSGPMIVLTSRNTSSGAEIVAAALQDRGRALIVGDSTTARNGELQSMLDVAGELSQKSPGYPLGMLKVSGSQCYRVNGESISSRGVEADVPLPSLTDYRVVSLRRSLPKISADRIAPANHSGAGLVSTAIKTQLRELSEQRRQNSPDFRQVQEDVARLKARNEQVTLILREEDVRQSLETIGGEDTDSTNSLGYYSHEVCAIAVDYVRLLSKAGSK